MKTRYSDRQPLRELSSVRRNKGNDSFMMERRLL